MSSKVLLFLLLFLLFCLLIFILSQWNSSPTNDFLALGNFLSSVPSISSAPIMTLPLTYSDDLWWTEITSNGQKFPVLVDTGSGYLTLPNVTCSTCTGPNFLNLPVTDTQSLTYGGGQEIKFETRSIMIDEIGHPVNVSVITSGTNPNGPVRSVLGLLTPSLGIQTLTLDFPNRQLILNPNLSAYTNGTPITTNRYLAVQLNTTGITTSIVSTVILDSGTNYVLSSASFPDGFNFTVGSQVINVSPELIRNYEGTPIPGSVVLGNKVMSNYRWQIDFQRKQIWI